MLDELQTFISAVESGSLTQAAKHLKTTIATVSRKITALESHLGCRLLHRSPRGLSLTQEGQAYYDECSPHIQSLAQRLDGLSHMLTRLDGPLAVLAPISFVNGPLDDFWEDFVTQYPDIKLSIMLSNEFEDVHQQRADLAIRIGPQPDSNLLQQRLGKMSTVLVASPEMLNPPKNVDELYNCPSVAAGIISQWRLKHDNGEQISLKKTHTHHCNELYLAARLAQSGAGIALISMSIVYKDLKEGRLMRVLPEWQGQQRDIYWVRSSRHMMSARSKVFVLALQKYLLNQPWFENGE